MVDAYNDCINILDLAGGTQDFSIFVHSLAQYCMMVNCKEFKVVITKY